MIDEILITLSESGGLVANKYTLTMEGENNSKGIVAFLPEKLSLYSFYIEFQKADGEKVTSKRLIPAEKDQKYFISYELSKPVLNVAGLLTVQFVARNESGVEWKSDTGEFFVKSSINAVEEIVETSSDLLADLQGQLDGKQDELIAGRNIELRREGEKVVIAVSSTSTGLNEEEVQEKIDENLVEVKKDILNATKTATSAKNTAELATTTATTALDNSNNAIDKANQSISLAETANTNSKNAVSLSSQANETAKEAKDIANYIDDIAGQALYLAGQTLGTANEAKSIATQTQADFEAFKTETENDLADLHETVNTEIAEQIKVEKTERQTAINELKTRKQDNLSFDGVYSPTTNKVATVKTVTDKVAEVVAGAPESLNTLKEIAEWIAEHPESVAQLNALIKANTDDIVEIKAEQATQNEDIQNNTALINDLADTAIRQIQKVERDFLESDQTINGDKTFMNNISLTDDGSYVSRTELALDGYRTAYGTDFIKWEGVLLYFPTAVDGSNQGDETLATREWVQNGIRSTAEPFLISKDVDGVRRSTLVLGEKGTKSTDGTIIYKAGLQSENTNITAYEIISGEKITRAGISLDYKGDIHAIGATFKWNEKEVATQEWTKNEFDIARCV